MSSQTKYEDLCTNKNLYSEEFIEKMGKFAVHWNRANWFQREASLRHDMVCMLLTNTEPITRYGEREQKEEEIYEPPNKRQRVKEVLEEPETSSSSSSKYSGVAIQYEIYMKFDQDFQYRYTLLEGRSDAILIQNKICELHKIDKLTRQYDIFDRVEKKFCEVKVTLNRDAAVEQYHSYRDDQNVTCFIHFNPENADYYMLNKRDEFPGIGKAISFLLARLSEMRILEIQDFELSPDEELKTTIFVNERFNNNLQEWTDTFWKLRKLELKPSDRNPNIPLQVSRIVEHELKAMLEDTTLREGEFMKFKGKLLPDQFTEGLLTTDETDQQMIDLLLEGTIFDDENGKWIVEQWNRTRDTFKFIDNKELSKAPKKLLENLGIGMKGTHRGDGMEGLVQEEFREVPKLRYSAWMSNLLKDSSEIDGDHIDYFHELYSEEMTSIHPMGKASQQIINKLFQVFGRTNLASYCSKIKNFYSRLGGAYLRRGSDTKRPAVVIFPLYSVGMKDGETIRKITGFTIRGPQHAKKSTDRIPFITYEMLSNKQRSKLYQQFIKKPKIITDNKGRRWCMRVNSILKQDPSYLSFVVNSIYLTANMLGEMTFANIKTTNPNIISIAMELIESCDKWLVERMAESVYMAVLGNSQEEGLLAGLRKVFMLKLNWHRGEKAHGSDIKGFCESINECLLDQPLALYFAKQFRDILNDE